MYESGKFSNTFFWNFESIVSIDEVNDKIVVPKLDFLLIQHFPVKKNVEKEKTKS